MPDQDKQKHGTSEQSWAKDKSQQSQQHSGDKNNPNQQQGQPQHQQTGQPGQNKGMESDRQKHDQERKSA